jgi:hypothetical protein
MMRQTVLNFKGALGFLKGGTKREENGNDSGRSSHSDASDDDISDNGQFYTSTGALIPRG